jgi:hypothetical protein
MWLVAIAAFGLLVPNGMFVYWLVNESTSLSAMLGDRLAAGFILDAAMATALLSWFFAVRPPGSVRWPWFLVFSLLGGLGFSIPFYLWLSRRSSKRPGDGVNDWLRGA